MHVVQQLLQSLGYPTAHPYAHESIGSMEDLAEATLEDARRFFEAYYSPNNAVLTIVGDVDPPTAIGMVERHFGDLPRGGIAPPRTFPAQAQPRTDPVSLRVERRVSLPRVYMSYPVPPLGTDTWDVAEVVADLLGRGRASRLYGALVREELAQEAIAWTYPLVDDPARLTVDVIARVNADTDEVSARILAAVEELGDPGPSESDLDRVRLLRHTEQTTDMERTQERADRIGMYASLLGTPERANEELARYESVDRDQVRDFVSSFLTPDRRVELTYVPQGS
jgi:Predicted Zn-dependent peptidases